MTTISPDPPRIRLDPRSYENLKQQVVRRDSWRCQSCGTMSNLEVHHKQLRSQSGHDSASEENLIRLCAGCHSHRYSGEGDGYVGGPKRWIHQRAPDYRGPQNGPLAVTDSGRVFSQSLGGTIAMKWTWRCKVNRWLSIPAC